MNDNELKDIIYFMKLDYEDCGYTDVLDRVLKHLTMKIIQERVIADKEFMKMIKQP